MTSDHETTATVGCSGCRSFHVPVEQIEEAIHDEIGRGYWKYATVEQAKRIALDARKAGPCLHSCHPDGGSSATPTSNRVSRTEESR